MQRSVAKRGQSNSLIPAGGKLSNPNHSLDESLYIKYNTPIPQQGPSSSSYRSCMNCHGRDSSIYVGGFPVSLEVQRSVATRGQSNSLIPAGRELSNPNHSLDESLDMQYNTPIFQQGPSSSSYRVSIPSVRATDLPAFLDQVTQIGKERNSKLFQRKREGGEKKFNAVLEQTCAIHFSKKVNRHVHASSNSHPLHGRVAIHAV